MWAECEILDSSIIYPPKQNQLPHQPIEYTIFQSGSLVYSLTQFLRQSIAFSRVI